jgi:O-acetyl-ADP-ribose deacetylase (regulator of RNase III)
MKYIKGDVVKEFQNCTEPASLLHQVNCQGVMNSGVAKQIREEYPQHFEDYFRHFERKDYEPIKLLGGYVVTEVECRRKAIVGLFGQLNYGYSSKRYTNYAALLGALREVCYFHLKGKSKRIFIPYKLGCDRGGGDWSVVSVLLEDFEKMYGIEFTIVELKK